MIGNLFGSFLAFRSESRARLTVTRLQANIRTGITSLKSNCGFESGFVSGFESGFTSCFESGFVSVSSGCWLSSRFRSSLFVLRFGSSLILDGFAFSIFCWVMLWILDRKALLCSRLSFSLEMKVETQFSLIFLLFLKYFYFETLITTEPVSDTHRRVSLIRYRDR